MQDKRGRGKGKYREIKRTEEEWPRERGKNLNKENLKKEDRAERFSGEKRGEKKKKGDRQRVADGLWEKQRHERKSYYTHKGT